MKQPKLPSLNPLFMKFAADINIAQSVIVFLRQLGHDVLDCKKDYLTAGDTTIIYLARSESRIILTRDKDFLELVKIPKYRVPVIVVRLLDQKPDNIILHLKKLLSNQDEKILSHSLTIITEERADSIPYAQLYPNS